MGYRFPKTVAFGLGRHARYAAFMLTCLSIGDSLWASTSLWPACDAIEATTTTARRGDRTAEFEFAECLYIGRGVTQDLSMAAEWYRRSADQGYAPAQYQLSEAYRFGRGVPKDALQAFQWMERAAKQGDINSQAALASIYATGDGVPKDAQKSALWTRKTAEQGDPGGQKLLGLMYENGAGVPKDLDQARYWYSRAATQRVDQREASSAQEYLDSLNHRLATSGSAR